jgi:hypothetical protein
MYSEFSLPEINCSLISVKENKRNPHRIGCMCASYSQCARLNVSIESFAWPVRELNASQFIYLFILAIPVFKFDF